MLVSPYIVMSSLKIDAAPVIRNTGNFILLNKTKKISVLDFKLLSYNTEKAETFNVVTIAKKDDPDYRKKITTFFSKEGEILRKVFEITNQPTVIRNYEQRYIPSKDNTVSKFRKIVSKSFDENTCRYKLDSVEEQKVLKTENDGIKLQINRNVVNDSYIDASLTEYTKSVNKKFNPKENKVLSMKIALLKDRPKIFDIFSKNIKRPKKDRFLPFRMIFDDNLKKLSFSKFLLKEKGLDSLNILIQFSNRLGDDIAAYFSEFENALVYNPFAKCDSVKLVAHEVEHAYQYSQIGRLGKGKSKYAMQSLALKGEITNPKEKNEALRFLVASENYPRIIGNKLIGKQPEYFNNLLELDADKEAQRVYDNYKKSGEDLAKQLFFGDF